MKLRRIILLCGFAGVPESVDGGYGTARQRRSRCVADRAERAAESGSAHAKEHSCTAAGSRSSCRRRGRALLLIRYSSRSQHAPFTTTWPTNPSFRSQNSFRLGHINGCAHDALPGVTCLTRPLYAERKTDIKKNMFVLLLRLRCSLLAGPEGCCERPPVGEGQRSQGARRADMRGCGHAERMRWLKFLGGRLETQRATRQSHGATAFEGGAFWAPGALW